MAASPQPCWGPPTGGIKMATLAPDPCCMGEHTARSSENACMAPAISGSQEWWGGIKMAA